MAVRIYVIFLLFLSCFNYVWAQSGPQGGVVGPGSGATGGVNFSGTPSAGYVPIATSPTTAQWYPGITSLLPGYSAPFVGSHWTPFGHANWNIVQTDLNYNPTEWQIYGAQGQGSATVTMGGNTLAHNGGTSFDPSWINQLIYFNGTAYLVSNVASSSTLTVTTTTGGSVSWPSTLTANFTFVNTTVSNICNVSGVTVTYVGGQPFVPFATNYEVSSAINVFVNGTKFTATYNSPTSMTLGSSAGVITNATCQQSVNVFDEISTLRVQKIIGSNEEAIQLVARATNEYAIAATVAGTGSYWPISFYTGENPVGTLQKLLQLTPSASGPGNPGFVSIGGTAGAEAIRVEASPSYVNYIDATGGPTTFGPSFRARGSDVNVGLGFDTQGGGAYTWTRANFSILEGVLGGGFQVGSPTGGRQGLGTINASSTYYANGSAGVTCSGTPTLSFASVNGIVTHC